MAVRKRRTIQRPAIVISKTQVTIATPWNEEYKEAFKRAIPFEQRAWDGEKKVWTMPVSKELLLKVLDLMKRYWGGLFDIRTDGVTVEEILNGDTMDRTSYYTVLRVGENASDAEIKKAYRQMAFKYHPDHGGDDDHFDMVNRAYITLIDQLARKKYDAARRILYSQRHENHKY